MKENYCPQCDANHYDGNYCSQCGSELVPRTSKGKCLSCQADLDWDNIELPKKKYQIIYADPPWEFGTWGKTGKRAPQNYYDCLTTRDICNLPISDLADDNCCLFLWVTFPALEQSFQVIKAWGFKYSTVAFTWAKLNKNNMGFFIGLGYWTRANAELCLLATRGNPKRLNKDVPQIIATPRMAHSRKPDEIVRDRIIRLVGDLPRIELFARRKVEGWDCWGNEVESDIGLVSQ